MSSWPRPEQAAGSNMALCHQAHANNLACLFANLVSKQSSHQDHHPGTVCKNAMCYLDMEFASDTFVKTYSTPCSIHFAIQFHSSVPGLIMYDLMSFLAVCNCVQFACLRSPPSSHGSIRCCGMHTLIIAHALGAIVLWGGSGWSGACWAAANAINTKSFEQAGHQAPR